MTDVAAAPVLAICGLSGSGKTTLIEELLPLLAERGLAIAVVKHASHGFEVDKAGKDSDRIFRAGANVVLRGPEEQFERRHAPQPLSAMISRLGQECDLLLVEGHKQTPLPKLWLHGAESSTVPDGVTEVLLTLDRDGNRLARAAEFVDGWLAAAWLRRPLYGGVLIGGLGSRMGAPKQLLQVGNRTLGETAVDALAGGLAADATVVILGSGALSPALEPLARLADPPSLAGPAAGLLAAHRWAPDAAWIVSACDHPRMLPAHITWMAAQRRPGCWAVIPRQPDGHPCPTLALYEPQALALLEQLVRDGGTGPSALLDSPRTTTPQPPPELSNGWSNVNTPAELDAEQEAADDRLR